MIKFNKLSVLLTVFAIFFCISAIGAVSASDEGLADTASPKYHIDSNNTGQSNYTGPQTNNTVWNFTTGGNIYYSSPAIGADGTIYIGSIDRKLYAINPDGTSKWNYTAGSYIFHSPAIGADGTIYFGSHDNNLHAVYPNGTAKWIYSTLGDIYGSPAIGADGTIYFGSYSTVTNNITALYSNGTFKWSYPVGGKIQGCPAMGADGTIYIGCNNGTFYAIKPDGTPKWNYTYSTPSTIYGSPAIGADGTIYFGDSVNFYALTDDGNNGNELWKQEDIGINYGCPAIGADGTLYFGSSTGYFYAFYSNGTQKWIIPLYSTIYSSPTIGADGTIYIASNGVANNGILYAFYSNGTQKWSYSIGYQIMSTPTIGADGTLYIGSYGSKVWAFRDNIPVPTANFTTDTTNGIAPLTVHFTDQSTGSPTSYAWDFDNDSVVDSTEQNPTYTYNTPGNYTVKLTVTNSAGSDEEIKTNYITVAVPIPTANFTTNTTTGIAPLTVQFTDQSTGFPASWAWDFNNDGITDSTEQNPTYTYNTPGIYTVKLTVTNTAGNDDEVKTDYIMVAIPIPTANFTVNNNTGAAPLTVHFTDQSTGFPASWAWDFNNDGIVDSTEQNPTYTYNTPGTYTVKLTVTNSAGSDDEIKTNYITVAIPIPSANFTANTTTGTLPLTVQFTDQSNGFPTSWTWDFNNDGIVDSTEQNPTYTYNTPGIYTVKLTVTNTAGSNEKIKTDYITVVVPAPIAGFSANVTNGAAPLTVQFNDNSSNAASWAWDFNNDGIIDSIEQNPTYNYSKAGTYTVKLTTTNAAGSDEEIKTDLITVIQPDLTVSSVSGPSIGIKGSTISIVTTILNQGAQTASNFVLRYLLSADTKFGADYWLADITIDNLAGLESLTSTNIFTVPIAASAYSPSIPLGNYYILCYIDRFNNVTESNEANNILASTGTMNITVKPDLTVISVIGPATGVKGSTVSVNSTIRNQGSGTASNFTVRYLLSADTKFGADYWLADVTINNLAAGQSLTSTNTFTIPLAASAYSPSIPLGNYYILCYVDRYNTTDEINETNNILASTGTINIISKPDLRVTSVSGPVTGVRGEQISIDSTILNQGAQTAGSFTVRYYLSADNKFGGDYWLGDVTVDNLAGSTSLNLTNTFTIPSTPTVYCSKVPAAGTYYILCYIDRYNTVNESNENNNVLTTVGTITIT